MCFWWICGTKTSAKKWRSQGSHVMLGPQRTSPASFDNEVGAGTQSLRNFKAECLRSLKIDDQLEHGQLLDWKIARLCCMQNLVAIVGRFAKHVQIFWSIRE